MLFFKTKSVGLGLSYLPQTQMWKYQTVMWLEPCKHFKFACGTKTPAFGQRVLSGSIFTFLLDFSSSLFTQWLVRFRRQNHLITVKMDPFTKLTIGYKASFSWFPACQVHPSLKVTTPANILCAFICIVLWSRTASGILTQFTSPSANPWFGPVIASSLVWWPS